MYPTGHKEHHSTQVAKRREADRVRKAETRSRAKESGIPGKSLVDHAVADATSFCISNADRRIWSTPHGWSPINAAVIYAIALDVLVHQHHKNRDHSIAALKKRLGKQSAHEALGHIPSTNPGIGHPVYKLTAPADVSAPKMPAPPLRPQDMSGARKWRRRKSRT